MKRISIFLFFILFCFLSRSQDTVVIVHRFYKSVFIKSKHIPLLVEFELSKNMLDCPVHLRRMKKFTADPGLPSETGLNIDYKNSGYDRGHNMSAQDNECEEKGMKECFYFTNIFPQVHSLNAGPWEELERHERKLAVEEGAVKVVVGNLGEIGRIGPDRVVVPEFCWKVICHENPRRYECYLMANRDLEDQDYRHYQVSLAEIERRSRLRLSDF